MRLQYPTDLKQKSRQSSPAEKRNYDVFLPFRVEKQAIILNMFNVSEVFT